MAGMMIKKKNYTYILECADGTLYTGWTNDLSRRVKTHNQGKGAKYTRSRLPVRLVYYEQHPDASSAMRREAEVKRLSRAEKIRMIEDFRKRREEDVQEEAFDAVENVDENAGNI